MDREMLGIFLQSGPARKFDVSRFTRMIATSESADQSFLFRNKFLNYTILFKCIIFDDYARCGREKSISTLVYMPYDSQRPNDGGESFVFSPANFSRYYDHKLHAMNIDLTAVEYDLELLKILDSLPTFSPLIVELALKRNNTTIPNMYLDLTPEVRAKLRAQLKGRIRPLIVAAYDRSSVSVEKAVEDMTDRFFSLHDAGQIPPLVQALRLPPENAVELLSSWIGVTYFEYEYSMIQNHLKEFAVWLSKSTHMDEHVSVRDKDHAHALVRQIKERLSIDWKRVYALSNEYRETYSDFVYNGAVDKFSKFLLKCKEAYWELGDLLGRFEQTTTAWRVFNASYHGKRIPFPTLMNFFVLLRKLHDAPPQVNSSDIGDKPAEGAGFPHFAADLF
jgi:hypothetical protein